MSWTPISIGGRRTPNPLNLVITTVALRVVAEVDRRKLSLTFYRGSENVLEDEPVLLAHMRDAGSNVTHVPRTILDLMWTMHSLGSAPRALEQKRDDSVMLTFLTPTALVELDFFDDHIEYSVFEKQAAPATWEELVFELELFRGE
jgi:hypothetical protein